LALAKQIGLAVDPERVLWTGRKLDRHLPPVRALVVVVPELEKGGRQEPAVAGRRPAIDPAVIFILIDERRGLALDDVVEVDERLAVRPILLAAILPTGSPQPVERRRGVRGRLRENGNNARERDGEDLPHARSRMVARHGGARDHPGRRHIASFSSTSPRRTAPPSPAPWWSAARRSSVRPAPA